MTRAMQHARRLAIVALALLLAASAGACGVKVRAPDLRPGEPIAAVFIADYGRHSSLLLPRDADTMAEYAFGEWHWYVLGEREWWRGPRILLFPSQATLGTRNLPPPADAAALVNQLGLAAAYEVRVSAAEARELLALLDARMAAASDRAVYSEEFGLDFVPVEDWYWLPYNCNTAVAHWLRRLECRVSGLAILSNFTVSPARGSRPTGAESGEDAGGSFPPLPISREPTSR